MNIYSTRANPLVFFLGYRRTSWLLARLVQYNTLVLPCHTLQLSLPDLSFHPLSCYRCSHLFIIVIIIIHHHLSLSCTCCQPLRLAACVGSHRVGSPSSVWVWGISRTDFGCRLSRGTGCGFIWRKFHEHHRTVSQQFGTVHVQDGFSPLLFCFVLFDLMVGSYFFFFFNSVGSNGRALP